LSSSARATRAAHSSSGIGACTLVTAATGSRRSSSTASAATFMMLHHVPTVEGQQRLLEEVVRVLRPGGLLVGADSLASNDLRESTTGIPTTPSNRGGCCAGCTASAAGPSRSPSTTT
jgi:hypothetical protein